MSSNKPTIVRLTRAARSDLDDIWRHTAQTWSPDQADLYVGDLDAAFARILAHPAMAREYIEFDPPVRILVHRSHLVIYRIEPSQVLVIRVIGGRQDWKRLLALLDY
jgi:toxin ParE1/3/4